MQGCASQGGGSPAQRRPRCALNVSAVSPVTTDDLARPPRDNDEWVRSLADDGPAGEAAQRELRRVLVGGLRRILVSRGVDEDLCEDFAQEALVRIRERLAAFRGESRFTTWALSIATRIAFDELRHKRWKDVSFEVATAEARGPLAFEPRADASQEKALVRERVLAELRDVIDNKLTDKQRRVLIAELNGMPHAEMADALGMNRNAVYKLSHDARRRVKFHLESAGLSEVEVLWVFE
jgi:RNA polymerase sigma-70 factor, ECF subfamily